MLTVNKLRADSVFDFAAEELKKYFRMMMPDAGDVAICYDPRAKEGFRLGLLEDFGLESHAEDPLLDDEVYIKADKEGGILAGSNPRSVLFAVYRFFKENGCRWLYPGIDGEYIPLKDILPVSYRKMAAHRFRGHCNEGAESQTAMLETIDFYAKQELNVYMLEFEIPLFYYNAYYKHKFNEKNRIPEPVEPEQVLQWKVWCETEIAKRGLQYHAMGHGWTGDPFGLQTRDRRYWKRGGKAPEHALQYVAEIGGERKLNQNDPLLTNVCMSSPTVRKMMVDYIANYAEKNRHVTYLHVWLADLSHNHCECENCRKMTPSDWYVMIMNELDDELNRRKIDTRIVFACYVDTLFAPQKMRIQNPQRCSLLYAPITRSYSSSVNKDTVFPEPKPFILNGWEVPKTTEESLSYLLEWQKVFPGCCFSYEYHFWRHQFLDPGTMTIARRIYEDIRGLKHVHLDGYVEDGSQRSFFPNGFAIYVYAEALLDGEKSFEEIREDYFSHIYGKSWEKVLSYLERMSAAFDFNYMEGERSTIPERGNFYDPKRVKLLSHIPELCAEGRALAKEISSNSSRPQTVSGQLLGYHSTFCELLGEIVTAKAKGEDEIALSLAEEFQVKMGKNEIFIDRYYDHALASRVVTLIAKKPKKIIFE
ncbi:MAG: DUF4838 domain-containing protein [Ruminococcaceae bacterium]|nr:DUF4838 domain-containing protein [Oscillospiraceae bacterium]